jgi:hypothetical protein
VSPPDVARGGDPFCSTIKVIVQLALRHARGVAQSLLKLAGLMWKVLDFNTGSWHQCIFSIEPNVEHNGSWIHLLNKKRAMAKKPSVQIPATLERPDVAVVPDRANVAVYAKMGAAYNLNGAKYGEQLDDKERAGAVMMYDAQEREAKYPGKTGRMSVWWLDLEMWPHLINPLCHYLQADSGATNRTAMFWSPILRVRSWSPELRAGSPVMALAPASKKAGVGAPEMKGIPVRVGTPGANDSGSSSTAAVHSSPASSRPSVSWVWEF